MKVVIFSGTTEGRELSRAVAALGIEATVCVATELGAEEQGRTPGITVCTGRLDADAMAALLQDAALCVDATHPYATEATRNICAAAAAVGVEYHRLLRPDAFEPYGLITQPERRNDCPDPVKWKQPDDMKPAGDHVVRWRTNRAISCWQPVLRNCPPLHLWTPHGFIPACCLRWRVLPPARQRASHTATLLLCRGRLPVN